MIRVLIADDQAMVRQGFGALLAAQPDLLVVGDAGAIKVDTRGLELTRNGETVAETFSSAHFAVEDEFRLFAEAIRSGRLQHNPPEAALADVGLVEAIMLAARSGTRVVIADPFS